MHRRFNARALVVLSLVIPAPLFAQSTAPSTAPATGSVSGTVVGPDGKPRAAAEVNYIQYSPRKNLTGTPVSTNDKGEFLLKDVPIGRVMILVETQGPYPLKGGLSADIRQDRELMLPDPIKLTGPQTRPTDVQAKSQWSGYIANAVTPARAPRGNARIDALLAEVPPSRIVIDTETWQKIWADWTVASANGRGAAQGKLPEIDFANDIIIISLTVNSTGQLDPLALDEKGNLTVSSRPVAADAGRGGYGFIFTQVSRKGIKSINGVPLQEPFTKATTQKAGATTTSPAK